MRYRLNLIKKNNNNIIETVQYVDANRSFGDIFDLLNFRACSCSQSIGDQSIHWDDQRRPLILQLMNCFPLDEANRPDQTIMPLFIRTLLSEFVSYGPVSEIWDAVCEEYTTPHNKYARYTKMDMIDRLISDFSISEIRNEWVSDSWSDLMRIRLNNSQLQLRHVEELCFLVVHSDFFENAVKKYLYAAVANIKDGNEYFYHIRATKLSSFDEQHPNVLWDEYTKLRNLVLFAWRYLYGSGMRAPETLSKATLFLKQYAGVDIHKLQINQKLDLIEANASVLADPEKIPENVPNLPPNSRTQPRIAHTYFWQYKDANLLRVAHNLQECYSYSKDYMDLDENQERALSYLCNQFSNLKGMISPSGMNHASVRYLTTPGDILRSRDLFDEIDMLYDTERKPDDQNVDYFRCADYFELCCASMYALIKNKLPVTSCSKCGRVFVPKQDRKIELVDGSKAGVYCGYSYPDNEKYTCSAFHSQFESGKSQNNIGKQISSIRTTVSNIDSDAPLLIELKKKNVYYTFIGFIRESTTLVSRQVKKAQKANILITTFQADIDSIWRVLNYFKQKRIKPELLSKRIDNLGRIFQIVDTCFEGNSFTQEYCQWKNAMKKIIDIL